MVIPDLPERVPSSPAFRAFFTKAREDAGLNQHQLARRAKVPRDFVKVLETRAMHTVAGEELGHVMAALGMSELPDLPEPPELESWWESPSTWVDLSASVAKALRARRENRGLTLTDVADRSGIGSAPVVRALETAGSRRRAHLVARLATALEIRPGVAPGSALRRLGFEWCGPPRKSRLEVDWNTVGLGARPDTVIARELGVPTRNVWRERRRRKIPAWSGKKRRPDWTVQRRLAAAVLENLGEPPRDEDGEIDWSRVPLGKLPDRFVARWLGAEQHQVRYRREATGLKPVRSLVDWHRLPLGALPDTHIAAMTGLTTTTVAQARNRLGISPCPLGLRGGDVPEPLDPADFAVRP